MNKVNLNTISLNSSSLNQIGEVKMGGSDIVVTPPIGVTIYTTDKQFYTAEEWDSANNDKVVGISINDGAHNFLVSKEFIGSYAWGGYDKPLNDVPTTKVSIEARSDFDGEGNTFKIIEQLKDYTDRTGIKGAPACEACYNYKFLNKKRGYLPSEGEWQLVLLNIYAVEKALTAINGEPLLTTSVYYYWASTIYDISYAWCWLSTTGASYAKTKETIYPVRPFSKV